MTPPYVVEAPGKVAHLYLCMNISELKVAEKLSRSITMTVGLPTGAQCLHHALSPTVPSGLREPLYEKSSYAYFLVRSIISWSSIKLYRILERLGADSLINL